MNFCFSLLTRSEAAGVDVTSEIESKKEVPAKFFQYPAFAIAAAQIKKAQVQISIYFFRNRYLRPRSHHLSILLTFYHNHYTLNLYIHSHTSYTSKKTLDLSHSSQSYTTSPTSY